MKLGFIGCGNMASAMMNGIIANGIYKPEEIIGADVYAPSREKVQQTYGIKVTDNNQEVVRNADVIVLSIKPQFTEEVINSIKDAATEEKLFITIIPGKTLSWLEEKFGMKVKVVRTMPNTPAMVGEGMTGACCNSYVTEAEMDQARQILSGFGRTQIVPEHMLDVVTGVSGSGPAYVFMFIEAMADAAVSEGMPRAQAYQFAAQTVMGSAKLVMETGKHPGELKDMVCSPAGTTIGAVRVLEDKGFRSAVIEAVKEATRIAKSL